MSLALAALSHAPSFGNVDPGGTIFAEINDALGEVRSFVEDFAPDVTVIFGPDHFNGVLYSMMPPFAIGAQAVGVGDYGTFEGHLPVDSEVARELHALTIAQGIDIARSERLEVDHGVMQPLEFLFGAGFTRPFVPVFVNALGKPLTPMSRIRMMGEAIQQRLVSYSPSKADRAAREGKIIEGIQAIADGRASSAPLNTEWDQKLLDVFRSGSLTDVDNWDNDEFIAEGGSAAHEMRSWIAAFSALSTAGDYNITVTVN